MKHVGPILALLLPMALAFTPFALAQNFIDPPERFNRPYPGGTSVYYYPKAEMWERCNALAGRKLSVQPAECAKVRIWKKTGQKRCFVFVAEHFRGTEFEQLLIDHGRAHCLGWWHLRREDHAQ